MILSFAHQKICISAHPLLHPDRALLRRIGRMIVTGKIKSTRRIESIRPRFIALDPPAVKQIVCRRYRMIRVILIRKSNGGANRDRPL